MFALLTQAVDYDGNTPLIWATRGGHRGCVGHLLDNGASTKTPDENGNTALHFSCQVCMYLFFLDLAGLDEELFFHPTHGSG